MFISRKCFNCAKSIKVKSDLYEITMQTMEGKHKVKVCGTCATQFDEIIKEIEEIHTERSDTI